MKDPVEAGKVLSHLAEIEVVAEEILSSRREIIDLDKQRNKTREAIRALQKEKKDGKMWLCAGNMFLKVENAKAVKILSKDFEILDEEVSSARARLKPKVTKLRDLEKKDDLKGFGLVALTSEERKSVESLL
ncbi:P53 and DNA damage-regulated protein 1-like [Plakobranchus ocellatus]|uniref:P53 and DNA damage-regulated protein 1-like n=1 Tax=Plakobranchus ocellatus TaxID=259542 RepID=A0AAV4D295_9GAST|nr:P53 and DNA damage-regulated protein 1-like [Plakobranchus ocellatus]